MTSDPPEEAKGRGLAPELLSEAALDAMLDAAPPPPSASDALKRTILADFEATAARRHGRASGARMSGGLRRWMKRRLAPAGLLAGLSALGFAAGVASANDDRVSGRGEEAAAYFTSVVGATVFAAEGETVLWDAD